MKKLTSSIVGGIAGAVALIIIDEITQKINKALPSINVINDDEVSKTSEITEIELPETNALFVNAMAIDLICNAFYYSIIGGTKRKQLPFIGAVAGLTAGVSNITVTEPVISNEVPPLGINNANLLRIARYTLGGLVAGSVMKAFRK